VLHSGPEVLLGDDSLSELGLVGLVLSGGDDDGVLPLGSGGGVGLVGLSGSDLLGDSSESLDEDGEDISEGEGRVDGVSGGGGKGGGKGQRREETARENRREEK